MKYLSTLIAVKDMEKSNSFTMLYWDLRLLVTLEQMSL